MCLFLLKESYKDVTPHPIVTSLKSGREPFESRRSQIETNPDDAADERWLTVADVASVQEDE